MLLEGSGTKKGGTMLTLPEIRRIEARQRTYKDGNPNLCDSFNKHQTTPRFSKTQSKAELPAMPRVVLMKDKYGNLHYELIQYQS